MKSLGLSAFLLLLLLIVVPRVGAASSSDVRASFASAFAEVKRAEQSGGDVSALLPKLNVALQLIDSGNSSDLVKAQTLIDEVSQGAQVAQVSGVQSTNTQYMVTGVSLVVLGASATLIYVYGGRAFWGVWVRVKRSWVVKGQ